MDAGLAWSFNELGVHAWDVTRPPAAAQTRRRRSPISAVLGSANKNRTFSATAGGGGRTPAMSNAHLTQVQSELDSFQPLTLEQLKQQLAEQDAQLEQAMNTLSGLDGTQLEIDPEFFTEFSDVAERKHSIASSAPSMGYRC